MTGNTRPGGRGSELFRRRQGTSLVRVTSRAAAVVKDLAVGGCGRRMRVVTGNAAQAPRALPKAGTLPHLIDLPDRASRVVTVDPVSFQEDRPSVLQPLSRAEIMRRAAVAQDAFAQQ